MSSASHSQKMKFWAVSSNYKQTAPNKPLPSNRSGEKLLPEIVNQLPEHLLQELYDSSQLVQCSLGWKLVNVFDGYLICFNRQSAAVCEVETKQQPSKTSSRDRKST